MYLAVLLSLTVLATLVVIVAYQLIFGGREIPANRKEAFAVGAMAGTALLSILSLALGLSQRFKGGERG